MKTKFPREAALQAARQITDTLSPSCQGIAIAGSLRRGRELVGDVEILYIPRTEVRQIDLLATAPVDLAAEALDSMVRRGILAKRPNINGHFAWGAKNKLALHTASGIPVDLFATTADAWWNYLVCRTGPLESNIAIASAAQHRGWKWHPYGPGFSQELPDGETEWHHCTSERDVFDFAGLDYKDPEHR